MTKAEEAAKEIYKDGIELFGRRDKSGNLIIHPEIMVGILRNAAVRGYEQAEKDLALTWEDMALAFKCVNEAIDNAEGKTKQELFEDALHRFNETRNE